MRRSRQPRQYTVINVSPRMSDEEREDYIKSITPALLSAFSEAGMLKEVSADYVPKEIPEVSPDALGNSMAAKMAREFINEHPNYKLWI